MRVAVRGLYFDHAFADFENRDVVSAAAKVEDGDRFVLLFVQTVGERRCRGLVHDAHHFKTGDLARVLCCLTLRVVEVRRNGDHRLFNFLSEIVFGRLLHFLKNHRRDFRRAPFFATGHDTHVAAGSGSLNFVGHLFDLFAHFVEAATHESFDRIDGILGVGDGLALGDLTNQAIAIFGKRHDRRGRATTFGVRDDDRLAPLHDRDYRVSRSQVNSNDFAHFLKCSK